MVRGLDLIRSSLQRCDACHTAAAGRASAIPEDETGPSIFTGPHSRHSRARGKNGFAGAEPTDYVRARRPGGAELRTAAQDPFQTSIIGENSDGRQRSQIFAGRARTDAARRRHSRQRRQGDARPEGPQRRPRQVVRRAAHHQGRRHRRQGDRACRQVREHGRADGARGRLQDSDSRRRRHHHRDRDRPGDRARKALKAVAAGANPMDLKRGIDIAVEAIVADLGKHSRRSPSPTRSPRSARSRPMATRRSAR